MNKVRFKELLGALLWFVLWAVVGYFLLVLVFCLPVERMQKHLESSVETFQGGSKALIKDDAGTWLDYLTDSTILSEAIYKGNEGPLEQAAAVYSNVPTGENDQNWPYRKLCSAMEHSENYAEYARYWHGYLLYIKPLLYIFDYKDILTLNMLLQLFLMLWIAQLLVQKNLKHLLLPEAFAFGMLNPMAMALCLQYMPCFYVMAAACIVLLKYPDFVRRHEGMYFLTIGMATCYFDFLTYPLVTLGIPLVLYLILAKKRGGCGLITVVRSALCWGVGYVVFWAEKWAIGSVILGRNLFADAWSSLKLRSSHETVGQTLTYSGTLQNNFAPYNLRVWKVLFVLILAALVLLFLIKVQQGRQSLMAEAAFALPLLVVACMPFAWYFATVNHSYIHYGYTHKEWMITGWALSCIAAEWFARWRNDKSVVQPKDRKE